MRRESEHPFIKHHFQPVDFKKMHSHEYNNLKANDYGKLWGNDGEYYIEKGFLQRPEQRTKRQKHMLVRDVI